MSEYKNKDLEDSAKALSNKTYFNSRWFDGRVNLIRLVDSVMLDIGRDGVSEITGMDTYTISASMCTIINFALADYINDTPREKYNSIKHGYRALKRAEELKIGIPDMTPNDQIDPSTFETFIRSDKGATFPKVFELRKVNKVKEVGISAISSTVNVSKIVLRITDVLTIFDLMLIALAARNGFFTRLKLSKCPTR